MRRLTVNPKGYPIAGEYRPQALDIRSIMDYNL
jgi:hypothetical protein